MKKILLFLLVAGLLAGVSVARAATVTIAGSPMIVAAGTTNSSSVTIATASAAIQSQALSVQVVTNLLNTNQIIFYGQVSLDNSNWFTVQSFQCPATNAATYPWTTTFTNMPIYGRIQMVTTNTSAIYIQWNN